VAAALGAALDAADAEALGFVVWPRFTGSGPVLVV
jgi:hypothetical protein